MSDLPSATIRIRVDPTNPGQFFACCGLLELASRVSPGAEGWFEGDLFNIASEGKLDLLLATLVMDIPQAVLKMADGVSVKPLLAPLRLTHKGGTSDLITLDSWVLVVLKNRKVTTIANRPWNLWSGNQTSLQIWSALRLALVRQLEKIPADCLTDILGYKVPLTGRFGFDPGAAWNALDVGFSPNIQQMPVASSPATELLAAIGIQRFRPSLSDDRTEFTYSTWGQPLLPSVAAAASSLVAVSPAQRFCGHITARGRYSALSYSTPLKGTAHD